MSLRSPEHTTSPTQHVRMCSSCLPVWGVCRSGESTNTKAPACLSKAWLGNKLKWGLTSGAVYVGFSLPKSLYVDYLLGA